MTDEIWEGIILARDAEISELKHKLQVAEQAIDVKQPGFDMYYHQLFAKERARSLKAEFELNGWKDMAMKYMDQEEVCEDDFESPKCGHNHVCPPCIRAGKLYKIMSALLKEKP